MTADYQKKDDSPDSFKSYFPIPFVFCAILGAAIWWITPQWTNSYEPWNAMPPLVYVGLMYLIGFFSSISLPPRFAPTGPIGLYMGQLIYTAVFYHPKGVPIFPLYISLAAFSLFPALVGAVVGIGFHYVWKYGLKPLLLGK